MSEIKGVQKYQLDRLAEVGIGKYDGDKLKNEKATKLYESNVISNAKNIKLETDWADNPASDSDKKQVASNILRNAQNKIFRTANHKSYEPKYDDATKLGLINQMYASIPYLNETAAEPLYSIGVRSDSDISNLIEKFGAHRGLYKPGGNYSIDEIRALVRETSQDIFEEILKKRDIHPDEWYDLYYQIELIVNSIIMGIGPPNGRYP